MTLQEAFDNNDKKGFLILAWNLCAMSKITYHEYCELKEVHDNWDVWQNGYSGRRVFFGNLGITDGRFFIL